MHASQPRYRLPGCTIIGLPQPISFSSRLLHTNLVPSLSAPTTLSNSSQPRCLPIFTVTHRPCLHTHHPNLGCRRLCPPPPDLIVVHPSRVIILPPPSSGSHHPNLVRCRSHPPEPLHHLFQPHCYLPNFTFPYHIVVPIPHMPPRIHSDAHFRLCLSSLPSSTPATLSSHCSDVS